MKSAIISFTVLIIVSYAHHGIASSNLQNALNRVAIEDTPIDSATRRELSNAANDCKECDCDKKESRIVKGLTHQLELISQTDVNPRIVNLALAGIKTVLKVQLAPYDKATKGLISKTIDKVVPTTDTGDALEILATVKDTATLSAVLLAKAQDSLLKNHPGALGVLQTIDATGNNLRKTMNQFD